MKYILVLIGIGLIAYALLYFIKLFDLLMNSHEFTSYGLGILAGKLILLVIGIFLLSLGIKKFKNKSPDS
jgi:hypothetical protein